MNEIYIVHTDWQGRCILDVEKNRVFRKDLECECGLYVLENNRLLIKWEKWNEEEFFSYDKDDLYYFKNIFDKEFNVMYVVDHNNNCEKLILKNNDNSAVLSNCKYSYSIQDNIISLDEFLILKKIIGNIYCKIDLFYKNIFFESKITNNSIYETYIFNKENKKFFNINNISVKGMYSIEDNCLTMNWNEQNFTKKFFSNKYYMHDVVNKNIIVIKPTNVYIDDRILFSNISLCKNKIVLTTMHYKINNWNLDDIHISINNCKIINKSIYDNDDNYESSTAIIIEIDTIPHNVCLKIAYKDTYNFYFYLEQLNIIDHNISAMTLFKDDYFLLERYLKYYGDLGVEVFYIYYNKKIDTILLEDISNMNKFNMKIYLVEWDYPYWWKDTMIPKYHFSQTMAINDSLNILKNYSNYCLYNDLDEYIILNETTTNFKELIELNQETDIFVFKNQFCKMGDNLIKYNNFNEIFDLSMIIKGLYYDQFREKNLIKLKSVNVMGVHKAFKNFSDNPLNEKTISNFYHIVNFEEKNRENLMNEYVY